MGDEKEVDSQGLEDIRHNLKVSFSRMKEDIHFNRQQIEDLIRLNKSMQEQMIALQGEIRMLKERPKGLRTELMRGLARNQKAIIKQRILGLVGEGRHSIPEIKDVIVDDKNYCSKASFYRYIDELKTLGKIDFVMLEGREIVVQGNGTPRKEEMASERENFV